MFGWSFNARTAEEVVGLLRAMQKHRYLEEVDHRVHWCVDATLAEVGEHSGAEANWTAFVDGIQGVRQLAASAHDDLLLGSRDPRLWRSVSVDEIAAVIELFWGHDARRESACATLRRFLNDAELDADAHKPFAGDAEEAPHPELLLLDWTLRPVDELDAERHAGALRAMEKAEEAVGASEPVYIEGPAIAAPELLGGAERGVLKNEWMMWVEGPYSYADYLFRGVARAAKLVEPPVGYRDV